MSRNRTTRTTAVRLTAAATLLLTLGACGSETGGDETDTGPATLTDQPFCDELDTAAVGDVLGLPADKVRTVVDREVGEEFEGPDEEAAPPTSVANLCTMGSGTSQLVVSVQPDATEADVQKTIDELSELSGEESSETCTEGDAAGFGDPAAAFTCSSNPPIKRVRVAITGLVGDAKFYCAAMVNQGAREDLAEATTQACSTIMEQLTVKA